MVNKDEYKKINNGISVTAAADYIVPDWPVSHYLSPVKIRPLRCGLSSKFFDHFRWFLGIRINVWRLDLATSSGIAYKKYQSFINLNYQ